MALIDTGSDALVIQQAGTETDRFSDATGTLDGLV